MAYHEKLIISGNRIELYKFEALVKSKPKWKKKKPRVVKRRTREQIIEQIKNHEESNFNIELTRSSSLRRTKSRITRLINSNSDMRTFITLTFKDNITDLFQANDIFKKFIKRLKRKFPQLKYLAVPEFQKDTDYYGNVKPNGGSVHYHLLVNIDYLDNGKLAKIWKQGFVMINKVRHINNLGLYISKYICKDLFDIRYFGMRKILLSRNLDQPLIFTAYKGVMNFLDKSKLKLLYESKYLSDWLGKVYYQLYAS